MGTGTVNVRRILRAPSERVYRAFLEAKALAKWLPPYGFTRTDPAPACSGASGSRTSGGQQAKQC